MKNGALSTFRVVTVSAALHFLVDALCLCCLYLLASPVGFEGVLGVFITYNVLAFLTQPLTGAIADRVKHGHWLLLTAVVLLTLGVLATSLVTLLLPPSTLHPEPSTLTGWTLTAILLGMGNSLFHVWGGRLVAVQSGNDMRALGIFVSTGAFGLAVGMVFYSWLLVYAMLIAICGLALCFAVKESQPSTLHLPPSTFHPYPSTLHLSPSTIVFLLLILLVVAGRSLLGQQFSASIPQPSSVMLLAIGALAMIGKMAGGWLCRWMGIIKAMAFVVVIVAVCWLFTIGGVWQMENGEWKVATVLLGLFAVNCTMPMTLYLANVLLPKHEGFAFGLLAAALIPGYLLAFI